MLIAQEVANATDNSGLIAIVLAVVAFATVVVKGVFDFVAKMRNGDSYSPAELTRRVRTLERGRDESEKAVSAARTEIAIISAIFARNGKK